MGIKKLNLGCGEDYLKGYVNLDIVPLKHVDVIHDLNKFPYPFKNDTFDEIICQDVLEHVNDVLKTLGEIHRILKPNGIVKIRVPHFTSAIAYTDPTHKTFFGADSFKYVLKNTPYNFYVNYSFESVKLKIEFGKKFAVWNWIIEPLANKFPRAYEDTALRVFPAMNIHVVLKKSHEIKKTGKN